MAGYPSDEIKALRKSGRLQEAYGLAKKLRAQNPDDRYIESELAWVVYGCLKRYKGADAGFSGNLDAFLQTFRLIPSLSFDPSNNGMFFENVVKLTRGIGWEFRKANNLNGLIGLLNEIINWGELSDCFRGRDTLLLFSKGFENKKAVQDAGQT